MTRRPTLSDFRIALLTLPLLGACQLIGGFEDHQLAPSTTGAGGGGTGGAGTGGAAPACVIPADCGADTNCGTRTCDGTCGWDYVAAGTVVGTDAANNCQAISCSGDSEIAASRADNTDLPLDVPNDCRKPACVSGVPSENDEATGTPCDDGTDEAIGECTLGVCTDCTSTAGCDATHVCLLTNTCCTPTTMVAACGTQECGPAPDGCGAFIACPDTCATSLEGPICAGVSCSCTLSSDCNQATHFGDKCRNTNVCGCDNAQDCDMSPRGTACVADVCGCAVVADCIASARGRACLGGTAVCGCSVANQAVDCAGIGPVTCNALTNTCDP